MSTRKDEGYQCTECGSCQFDGRSHCGFCGGSELRKVALTELKSRRSLIAIQSTNVFECINDGSYVFFQNSDCPICESAIAENYYKEYLALTDSFLEIENRGSNLQPGRRHGDIGNIIVASRKQLDVASRGYATPSDIANLQQNIHRLEGKIDKLFQQRKKSRLIISLLALISLVVAILLIITMPQDSSRFRVTIVQTPSASPGQSK